jgi:hypothetical protein
MINNLDFQYLDLLKINHYDNPARMTSLKKLEFNYRRKKILDLPFHHSQTVTKLSELEDTIRYCMEDVDTTEECYEHSLEAIKFRQDLSEKFNRPDFMNYSDVKIGEELNLTSYCEFTGLNPNDVKRNIPSYPGLVINFRDCIPDYIKFNDPELIKVLEEFKNTSVRSTKGYKKEIIYKDNIITFGQGGIHNVAKPQIVKADENFKIITVDVGSQYPSNMIKRVLYPEHLGKAWVTNIENTYNERVNKYKPYAKTDPHAKNMSEVKKLQLNGGSYGKTNSEFSWQYDPRITMAITITCQLELMMLAEKLLEADFKLILKNTDGQEWLISRDKEQLFYDICNQWEIDTLNSEYGRLEYGEYKQLIIGSVNDYIGEDLKGNLKRKGSFMIYEDIKANNWHKDSSGMIISLALQEYYINNIPVEDTINNCNNIFEFCYGSKKQKAPKQGDFKWLISEVGDTGIVTNSLSEDRFIRYYIGGTTTINKLYEGGIIKNLPTKGEPVTVAQYIRREEIIKDGINMYKNLNKQFYINEANNIIKTINNEL